MAIPWGTILQVAGAAFGAATAGKGKEETRVVQEVGQLSKSGQRVLNAYNQIYSMYPIPELANQYINQVNWAMSQFADLAPRIISSVGDVKVSIGGKGVKVKPLGAIKTLISSYLEPLQNYMQGAHSTFQNMMAPAGQVLTGEYGGRGFMQTQVTEDKPSWGVRIGGAASGMEAIDIILGKARGFLGKGETTPTPGYKEAMLGGME